MVKIEELQKNLETFNGKLVSIIIDGFIGSKFLIDNLKYTIESEILNIKNNNSYLKINLNQAYDILLSENQIKFFLDNDITISLSK